VSFARIRNPMSWRSMRNGSTSYRVPRHLRWVKRLRVCDQRESYDQRSFRNSLRIWVSDQLGPPGQYQRICPFEPIRISLGTAVMP